MSVSTSTYTYIHRTKHIEVVLSIEVVRSKRSDVQRLLEASHGTGPIHITQCAVILY